MGQLTFLLAFKSSLFFSFFFSFSALPKTSRQLYQQTTKKDNWKNTIDTAQQKVLLAYPWYSEVSGRIKGMSKGHAIILSWNESINKREERFVAVCVIDRSLRMDAERKGQNWRRTKCYQHSYKSRCSEQGMARFVLFIFREIYERKLVTDWL